MTKNLRLLLFEDCEKNCPMCVNNDWDLEALEVETDYTPYDMILITGGEPLLYPEHVIEVIEEIRETSSAKICVYTAKLDSSFDVLKVLNYADGITVTLHEQDDLWNFNRLNELIRQVPSLQNKSLRLNVFMGIDLHDSYTDFWKVQDRMVWIKNCPLPKNEVFKRYQ